MDTILIVEDELNAREALTELLQKDGREIITAGDGQEALELLRQHPDSRLILLDLMMPRMDGNFFGASHLSRPLPTFRQSYCPARACQPEPVISCPNPSTLKD